MRFYENIFIGRQDLSQNQVEALASGFSAIITNGGGEVVRAEYCGLRNLAYKIKKNKKGHYYLLCIKASNEILTELERVMRINEDILRFLTIHVDSFDMEPCPLLFSKKDRDYDEFESEEATSQAASEPEVIPQDSTTTALQEESVNTTN